MIINVIVPVCSLHIKYMHALINSIKSQTRKPDKVIFIINEYDRYIEQYDKIISENTEYCYVKINVWKSAAENRNIGYDYVIESDESIVLFYDVDDIMSPILCEVVEDIFIKYKCDLFVYGASNKQQNIISDKKDMRTDNMLTPAITTNLFNNKSERNRIINFRVAYGECAVSYKIIKNKKYFINITSGEDRYFVKTITSFYKNTYITPTPLSHIVGDDHIRIEDGKIFGKNILDYVPNL